MGTYISKGIAGFAKYTNSEYIDCNFNGVKDTLESLIKGVPVSLNVLRFGNDIYSVSDNEELFTLLIHFGYLSYDRSNHVAVLPNQEIREWMKLK